MTSAQEIVERATRDNPGRHFAINHDESLIGVWSPDRGRYVAVASLAITGEWVAMPYEILANGQPMHLPADWPAPPIPQPKGWPLSLRPGRAKRGIVDGTV